ncbi:MAG: hypothetical protein AB7O59_14145 [Pirellulales bacterium]
MLAPTADGGPPLARPIIIVRLSDEQMCEAREAALVAASQRDAALCKRIADEVVREEFWWRDTEERAMMKHFGLIH